jgi:hypothetical protein
MSRRNIPDVSTIPSGIKRGYGRRSIQVEYAVEMRAFGVKLSDWVRNEAIREECCVKEDVVTKIEKNIL